MAVVSRKLRYVLARHCTPHHSFLTPSLTNSHLHHFRPYLFVLQMGQIPLIMIGRIPMIKKNKLAGNIVFWLGLLSGFPLLAIGYVSPSFPLSPPSVPSAWIFHANGLLGALFAAHVLRCPLVAFLSRFAISHLCYSSLERTLSLPAHSIALSPIASPPRRTSRPADVPLALSVSHATLLCLLLTQRA